MSQRRHNLVEIACLYLIIPVSSVPMYGGLEGVLGHEKGTWSCLCQAPGQGNVVKVNIPCIVFDGGGIKSYAVEVGIILFAA